MWLASWHRTDALQAMHLPHSTVLENYETALQPLILNFASFSVAGSLTHVLSLSDLWLLLTHLFSGSCLQYVGARCALAASLRLTGVSLFLSLLVILCAKHHM